MHPSGYLTSFFGTWAFVLALSIPSIGCSEEDSGPLLASGGKSSGTGGGSATFGGSSATFGGSGTVVLPNGGRPDPGTGNGGASGSDCNPKVVGLLRDFKAEHPDFEEVIVTEKGIVGPDLGPDKKPIFAGAGLKSVTTAENFDQWYRDTPGVNQSLEHEIVFTAAAGGLGIFDSTAFFPLDEQLFGNEGSKHNFHFTFELHMEFKFNGGERFTFRGDDDLFVFINNKLAVDLGGVHGALTGTVTLDEAKAAELGITPGNNYPLDFFHAERHTSQSNFHVETNLNFTNCVPIIVR